MNKLVEAKELTTRAQNFIQEGNYEYAIRCYDKIILLLQHALIQATSKDTIQAVKQKIAKFIELRTIATAKQDQKSKILVKASKFGFPTQDDNRNSFNICHLKNEISNEKGQIAPQKYQNHEEHKGLAKHKQKMDIPPAIAELIVRNIDISFKDIVGLKDVIAILEEAVIRPRQRPDLFTGIRAPPKGLLLYGPPGNGKTYLCKALAKESECTFFSLSASSILNKLVGQSEKMIKRVFAAAEYLAPSIIFIDQIDSMLTARSQNQNQSSRRLKTEFLVLMDGISSPKSGDILVIGATNLPRELDTAAKRRFSKMIYVGNPDKESRRQMLLRNLKEIPYDLSKSQLSKLVDKFDCYSASQMHNIIAQTCMIPLRQLQTPTFKTIKKTELRKIGFKDFAAVLSERKPLLSKQELAKYKEA